MNGLCKECGTNMLNEGVINDDIPLCHGCYSNQTLAKHGYLVKCGDCLRPECEGCEA